jgi:ElaB/YqjD/DUF883 family membrane-anchored ribosome-binding protein
MTRGVPAVCAFSGSLRGVDAISRGEAMAQVAQILEKAPTVDEVVRGVSRIKSVVTDAMDDGIRSARRAAKQGKAFAQDTIHDARYAIKRKPLQSAAVVLAAGVVIGSFITWILSPRD